MKFSAKRKYDSESVDLVYFLCICYCLQCVCVRVIVSLYACVCLVFQQPKLGIYFVQTKEERVSVCVCVRKYIATIKN
jgi:hypothetical protein